MKNETTLQESFETELADVSKHTVLSPHYRKKKLIFWALRTVILMLLYVIFWKHDWVRKSLYFTIPLTLLSLSTIIAMPYLIRKKIQKTERKVREADQLIKESNEKENNIF